MENPITNTLFRFVSVRSPQLIDPKDQPVKFVSQPSSLQTGLFYDAVANRPANTLKIIALQEAAQNFPNPFTSENNVKALAQPLYDFGVWIARNKASYTTTELQNEAAKVSATVTQTQLRSLWDNLFYQVVTQKSFYTKEAIMQMLVADHVFTMFDKNASGFSEYNDDLLNASVSLPAALFDDSEAVIEDPLEGGNKPLLPTAFYQKKLALTEAKHQLKIYSTLRKELQNSEKKYNTQYEQTYDTARKAYDAQIAPTMETYYNDLEAARKAYCAVHDDTIPYDPEDPCQRPDYVPYPNLPAFEYTVAPEVTHSKMQQELSNDSYNTLLGALGYNFKEATPAKEDLFIRFTTYQTLYSLIQSATELAYQKISANAELNRKQINVNGISVPVLVAGLLQPFNFKMFASLMDMTSIFTLVLGVPDSTWQITNIRVIGTRPDNTTFEKTFTSPEAVMLGDTLQLNGFYKYSLSSFTSIPTLEFELTFSNGVQKRISGIPGILNYGLEGIAEGEASNLRPGILPPSKTSGIGYRTLGAADYLRLEQTVQCYLEGEVSHIENIMAREYKEKSTRVLRRTEETTTTTFETEQEKLSDTTTTDRFEMQSEIGQVLDQSKDMSSYVSAGFNYNGFMLNSGVNVASNTSKQDSIRQATTTAQEITERAMDRVVSRIKEERVVKILEEYEENNKHGFDNRQGSEHVVGVYRWVDKLYKNQIMNYGTRMMLEFMVPEPSKLHVLAMTDTTVSDAPTDLVPPVDPRTYEDTEYRIYSYAALDSARANYWASIYNTEIEPKPEFEISVGDSFNIKWDGVSALERVEANAGNGKITLPEGYKAVSAVGIFSAVSDNDSSNGSLLSLTVGNSTKSFAGRFSTKKIYLNTTYSAAQDSLGAMQSFSAAGYVNEVPVSFTLGNHVAGDVSVTITCQLSNEGLTAWQQKTFKAIIDAYEEALAAYNEKAATQQTVTTQTLATNPGFFRQIENIILRKNCISYLIDRTPTAAKTYGKSMSNNVNTFEGYEVDLGTGKNFSDYASFVQFIEQAFEWEIMSYNFYPYYWGSRANWASLYRYDQSNDSIFRAFMQAGMARVIVTVRPGFEDAVALFLSTGLLWNGGSQPSIGDPMYQSLIDEVKKPKADKYGKAWLTRIPTTLTILQASSIGLKVEKALPCDCENTEDFEEGTILPCGSNFEITNAALNQSQAQKIRFSFLNFDRSLGIQAYTIGEYDQKGLFPRVYECMGQTITIDRDAAWAPEASAALIFQKLAGQLSLISGVQAEQIDNPAVYPISPDCIRFTIDTSINPDFNFIKKQAEGGWVPDFDMIRVITSNGTVRVVYSEIYIMNRVTDKIGVPLLSNEANALLPISRFSV